MVWGLREFSWSLTKNRILYHKSLSNKQENEEIVSDPFLILVWSMSLWSWPPCHWGLEGYFPSYSRSEKGVKLAASCPNVPRCFLGHNNNYLTVACNWLHLLLGTFSWRSVFGAKTFRISWLLPVMFPGYSMPSMYNQQQLRFSIHGQVNDVAADLYSTRCGWWWIKFHISFNQGPWLVMWNAMKCDMNFK